MICFSQIKQSGTEKCLDAGNLDRISTYLCHTSGGNQFFAMANDNTMMTHTQKCITVGLNDEGKYLKKVDCDTFDPYQQWEYDKNVSHHFTHRFDSFKRCLLFFIFFRINGLLTKQQNYVWPIKVMRHIKLFYLINAFQIINY